MDCLCYQKDKHKHKENMMSQSAPNAQSYAPATMTTAKHEVFLGGTCGSSTWRTDVAIVLLDKANVTYFNPQLPRGQWHEGLIEIEREAREQAQVELFIIDGSTRGVASLVEASALVVSGRRIVIMVEEVEQGSVIDGEPVGEKERKDLNRGRKYLLDVVQQSIQSGCTNIYIATTFEDAATEAANLALRSRPGESCKRVPTFKRKSSL